MLKVDSVFKIFCLIKTWQGLALPKVGANNMKPPLPYDRGKQILKLLALHEPLSVRGLSQMLEPQIEPRRLRDALSRLYTKNFRPNRLGLTNFGSKPSLTFLQAKRDMLRFVRFME